jgi:hypothetical protein
MASLQDTKRIEKLMTLFRGSDAARGVFMEAADIDPLKPKVKGKALTVSKGPTFQNWLQHYEGKTGLGVIPITTDDTCYWGVLDVDGELDSRKQPVHDWECLNEDGTINHIVLQNDIQTQELPLVVCYSKSKSAHCFLFVEEPIPAQAMRSILEEMASRLGVGGCEIFPKQDKIDTDRGDLGNWLNMPYYGGTRLGVILQDGKLIEQDIDAFLDYAFSKRLSKESLDNMAGDMRESIASLENVLEGAPPCLQHILQRGIPVGSRNNILFNVGVYCYKRYGDDFRSEFSKLHDKYVDEPLGFKELEAICVSVEKKEYQYQCKEPLLKKYCNANICMDRECGIDFSSEIKTLKSATRILTDPVVYAVEVEMGAGLPHTVYVETDQLFAQDQFRKECSLQLHKTFVPISAKAWNDICVRLINTAINQEPPYEMSEHGQIVKLLKEYLVNRVQGKRSALSEEEGVYHDFDKHLIYFRLDGLKNYMTRKGAIPQNYSKWKLNKKIEDLEIPTEEISDTGASVKCRLGIYEERIRIGKGLVTVRVVPDKHLRLEETINVIEGGDVV